MHNAPALLVEGRRPEASKRAEQGTAPAAGRHAGPGRPGAPPGGHYGPPARSWLTAAQEALRKAWPGTEKSRSRAPRGAPPGSQRGAARFAPVLGDLASHPGVSHAPAFLGAPLPLFRER